MPKIAMLFVTTTDIPIADALVEVRLTRSDFDDKISGVLMNRLESFRTDANGEVTVDLMTCKALYHVTVYDTVQDIAIHHDFYVPEDADPTTVLRLQDLIVPPDTYLSSLPFDETAMLAIIDARNAARDAALQSQASAATAVTAAATAVAAIDNVKANADKVEAWAGTVDRQHTEVGGWAIQVAQNKTAVDAAVIEVNQDKDEAVNAAAGAKTSETNAANSAAAARTDSLSATASKTAAAASATAADASKNAALNYANTAVNNSELAYAYAQSALADAGRAATSAATATTAKNDSLAYKDQAFQYMTSAQAAKGSAEGSAAAALASANSATASATTATGAATTSTAARDVAVDAKNKAETAWTDFDKRYFGAFAANPTVNAHGAAPVVGSLYWNTVTKTLFVWTGTVWYEITLAYRTAQNRKIVVFGSSVAVGQGSPTWNGWATRLSVAMTARGYTMVNKSVGGNKTADLIGRFYTDVVPENPGIVIISLSLANEGLLTGSKPAVYSQYIAGMRRLVAMCREMGYKVVVTGVYSNNDYTAADYPYLIQADQELEYSNIPYINFLGAVDDGTGKWRTGMWADALHPNDIGHEALFRAFPLSLFDNLSTGRSSNIQVVNPNIMKVDGMADSTAAVAYTSESPFGSFTVMARIRRTYGLNGKPLIAIESSTTAYPSIRVRNEFDAISVTADATNIITSTVPTSSGKELCLILSFDYYTNTWRFWIDGFFIGSAVYAPTAPYDQIAFGGRTNAAFNVNGYEYADMAVWRTALTAEQVAEATAGRINKASLNMYSPVVDALVPMNFNLVNLAPSSTSGRVGAAGITTYPRNITASDVATPYALVKTQGTGLINNALLDTTEAVRPLAPVRTQANGYIKTGLLDPNQTIYTDTPLAVKAVGKFGYSYLHGGQAQLLYKIATLPTSGVGTYASLRIDAMLGGWSGDSLTAMTVTMGNRNAFSVDWSAEVGMPTEVKFVVFVEADSSHSVYLMFNNSAFAQASFDLHGMGCQSYSTPVGVNTVTGTAVWDSSAPAGATTYKAPRFIGMSPGKGTSFDSLVEIRAQDGVGSSTSYIAGAPKANTMAAKQEAEFMRIGVSGNSGVSYAGFFNAYISVAEYASPFALGYKMSLKARDVGSGNFTPTLFSVTGYGVVYVPLLKAGSSDSSTLRHNISRGTGQGAEILYVGVDNAVAPSVAVLAADGAGGWSASLSVMYVGKNSTTNRGIATPGTVNAQGTDYAEYFVKALSCGPVVAGQLVGVDNKNHVTDLWAEAVMFAIKSTDPSFVGGDSWSSHLGNRPAARAGVEPVSPTRMVDVMGADPENPEGDLIVTTPGDTDEEWEAKMADYSTAVAEWEQTVETDRLAQVDFDAKLEEARARVDRIAIAGRVPVNVMGAQPGDYIVPVQDGEGIKGIAVKEDDMTLRQYLRAVGQVITIEEDGRAYVMVKSV